MLTAAWKNKAVAALLFAVLFAIFAPCAQAAEMLDSTRLQHLFPSARQVKDNNDLAGIVFRIANCPCYALVDSRTTVRYIFVFQPEKERKSRKGVSKAQTTAEQLAKFLSQSYGKAELHTFFDQESGYVISIFPPQYSAYAYSSSSRIKRTSSLIAWLVGKKGTFHHCDGGELTLQVSTGSADNDVCYVSLFLFKSYADIIGFVPGRYTRRSDEKIVMSAASILNLRTPYDPESHYRYDSKVKEIRNSTGATKCIGFTDEWAMVVHRRRYYIGNEKELSNFIRRKKLSGYARKFDFPQQSDSIPSAGDEENTPKEKGAAQETSTPSAAEENKSGGITTEQICDYFDCSYFVEKDGCACFRFDNCRVVIPLPDAGKTDGQSPSRLPIQTLYVYTTGQSTGARPSQSHALFLSFMLSVSDCSTVGLHPLDNTISVLKFRNGKAPKTPKEAVVKELLHAGNFPDTQVHPWPEKSRAGKAIPGGWLTLITPKPDAALKDYMEYLLRLMK